MCYGYVYQCYGPNVSASRKRGHYNKYEYTNHRVDREDITIIILDTKLVPDFVPHACCFFIAGNRHVPLLLSSANKSVSDENRAAKS